jgi:quinol monooxygenase YgiN
MRRRNYGERLMILVMGYMQLVPGGIAAMRSALAPMIAATRAEPGCNHYALSEDIAEPDRLHVAERWTDQAALGAHLVSDHLVAFQLAMRRTKVLKADINVYHPDGRIERLVNV